MTVRERILAMVGWDQESADLVLELLARPDLARVRRLREKGGTTGMGPVGPAFLPEPLCPTCLHSLVEGFCGSCGYTTRGRSANRQEINREGTQKLSGLRAPSQEEEIIP